MIKLEKACDESNNNEAARRRNSFAIVRSAKKETYSNFHFYRMTDLFVDAFDVELTIGIKVPLLNATHF